MVCAFILLLYFIFLELSSSEEIASMSRTAMAEPLLNICERRKYLHSIDYTPQYSKNQSKQWSQSSIESAKPKKVVGGGMEQ